MTLGVKVLPPNNEAPYQAENKASVKPPEYCVSQSLQR